MKTNVTFNTIETDDTELKTLVKLIAVKGDKGEQGEQGEQGIQGEQGFSPTVTVETDTQDEYILKITAINGVIITPNLKGADGTTYGINATYGITLHPNTNTLQTDRANQEEITAKISPYKPIVPQMLDFAVKAGLINNSLSLTAEEKIAVLTWLGVFDNTYTKEQIDTILSSVYKYKGSVATVNDLPTTDLTIGDVYNVEDTGVNYAWTGTEWDSLAGIIDLSNLVTLDTAQIITGVKTITNALFFTNNNRTGVIYNSGDIYNLVLRSDNQNIAVRAAALIPFGNNNANLGTGSYHWNNGYITNIYGDTGTFTGSVTSGGADYAEYFEWKDGNPDNKDRIGLLVTLDGDKIIPANSGNDILGITSGTVAFLGDNYATEWQGKYLKDDFGRLIYEPYEYIEIEVDEDGKEYEVIKHGTRPILNPDYNPETEYIPRSQRQEWETVGMVGKLFLRDDGTAEVNGYVTAGENGVATASGEKTNIRVLARVKDNIIKVLLK